MAEKLEATRTKPQKVWNLDIGEQIRDEELDGRKFVVVPMTMILEGVHTGSQGPVYYSVEELAKTPKMWNMKPIVIEHPFRGDTATDLEVYKKQAVGMIMNTYFDPDEGKLKAEAWIDKDLAQNKYPQLLEHIEHRLPMEVSTGLFSELILEPGTWKGEEYKGRIVNIRADHLAILPHKQGACSLADGAGLLINESFDESAANDGREQLFVFTTVINEYPPGTQLVEDTDDQEPVPPTPKKPRLKNTQEAVAKMSKPIESRANPYEINTDEFKMIVIPKNNRMDFEKSQIPQMSVANYSEVDEEDLPIPEKQEEAIRDNAKVLSPDEQAAEAQEDAKTGKKDYYVELKNRLAAALIRRHMSGTKNVRNSKKKLSSAVKNDAQESAAPAELPSLALGEDAFAWDTGYKDIFFRTQAKLYDALVNRSRFDRFNNDIDSVHQIISELSSLLLVTFPVSNINKIRGLMEFAKSEPPEQAVFNPADIALVEHTIAQIDQAKADEERLSGAFRDYRSKVRARGGNDKFYNMPANFLTGAMKASLSPLSPKETKSSLDRFDKAFDKLHRNGKNKKPSSESEIASKLNVTSADSKDVLAAKKQLGHAAIILGKYAEKGVRSNIHPRLLIGDSRDELMRDSLSAIYDTLDCIFTGRNRMDPERKDPYFQTMVRSPLEDDHLLTERYNRCRRYAEEMVRPGIPGKAKSAYMKALTRELRAITGLKKDENSPAVGPSGLIDMIRLHFPSKFNSRKSDDTRLALIRRYAKELIDMLVMRLNYDAALQKAQEEYAAALGNIDALGLPDDVKEEFVTLPERLLDPERQKRVAASLRNADKLQKYLFRRELGRVYGLTDSMDTALSQEMLRVAGVIPAAVYDKSDQWLASARPEEGAPPRLADLVSTLPDARSTAREILSRDPELIQSILGGYQTTDEESKKKVEDFLNTHEFKTRSELLSQHNPEYRQMNDEIYQFMKGLENYDPNVGFTPEQKKFLYDNGWFNAWFKANSSTRGYVDYLDDWKKNGDGNVATKFDNFKPQRYMLDSLLALMRQEMMKKRFPADRLYERNAGLGRDVADAIQSAPEQSRLISDDWATNKYTASLGRYTMDPDGEDQMNADLEGDPVHTKITLLYKAFKDQFIATKANILIDRLNASAVGPVEGEVPVENA